MENKPRSPFCWLCSGKLQGNHHREESIPQWTGDDIPRIFHKSCFKKYEEEVNYSCDVQVEMDDYGHVPPQSKLFEEEDEFGLYGNVFV